jgi:hypothetical protein
MCSVQDNKACRRVITALFDYSGASMLRGCVQTHGLRHGICALVCDILQIVLDDEDSLQQAALFTRTKIVETLAQTLTSTTGDEIDSQVQARIITVKKHYKLHLVVDKLLRLSCRTQTFPFIAASLLRKRWHEHVIHRISDPSFNTNAETSLVRWALLKLAGGGARSPSVVHTTFHHLLHSCAYVWYDSSRCPAGVAVTNGEVLVELKPEISVSTGSGARNLISDDTNQIWQSSGTRPHHITVTLPAHEDWHESTSCEKCPCMHKIHHMCSAVAIYTKDFESYSPELLRIKVGSSLNQLETAKTVNLTRDEGWQTVLSVSAQCDKFIYVMIMLLTWLRRTKSQTIRQLFGLKSFGIIKMESIPKYAHFEFLLVP